MNLNDYIVVIPARYASSRLPGKPLLDVCGMSLVERVYRQASQSDARRVLVATDDARIADAVSAFGGEAIMTAAEHASGTDRLAEVARLCELASDDIVVNVQGDEPLIPPAVIDQVAGNLIAHPEAGVATLCEPLAGVEGFLNPNVVKVVADQAGYALYFTRAPVPWPRDHFARSQSDLPAGHPGCRHIGLYAYRAGTLQDFVAWPAAELEETEALEQLRFMVHGVKIHVTESVEPVPGGVDTPADLDRVIALLSR